MNKLEFNKSSWHYWFVNKTTSYIKNLSYDDRAPDICGYTRAFIGGSIKILILGTIIGLSAFAVSCSIAFGLSLLFKWHLPKLIIAAGQVGMIMVSAAASVFGIGFTAAAVATIRDKISDRRAGKAPGALIQMYRSWKEKTCAQIEFK